MPTDLNISKAWVAVTNYHRTSNSEYDVLIFARRYSKWSPEININGALQAYNSRLYQAYLADFSTNDGYEPTLVIRDLHPDNCLLPLPEVAERTKTPNRTCRIVIFMSPGIH